MTLEFLNPLKLYTHINWGGRFRLSVFPGNGFPAFTYKVYRWGKNKDGFNMKSVGWEKAGILPLDDLVFFMEV